MHVRWLCSVTRITYLSKLIGILSLAAFLKFELFRISTYVIFGRIISTDSKNLKKKKQTNKT
ncbi:hypothetical protein BV925_20520 [Pectobacterium odoriferum]|nr:hypothetical protein BV925_20520 [Pectobacterium odoriferum]